MKNLKYKNGYRVEIIEEKDAFSYVCMQMRGKRLDLVCIPITYLNNSKFLNLAMQSISIGSCIYGGLMYYTDLDQLHDLLKPVADLELFPTRRN